MQRQRRRPDEATLSLTPTPTQLYEPPHEIEDYTNRLLTAVSTNDYSRLEEIIRVLIDNPLVFVNLDATCDRWQNKVNPKNLLYVLAEKDLWDMLAAIFSLPHITFTANHYAKKTLQLAVTLEKWDIIFKMLCINPDIPLGAVLPPLPQPSAGDSSGEPTLLTIIKKKAPPKIIKLLFLLDGSFLSDGGSIAERLKDHFQKACELVFSDLESALILARENLIKADAEMAEVPVALLERHLCTFLKQPLETTYWKASSAKLSGLSFLSQPSFHDSPDQPSALLRRRSSRWLWLSESSSSSQSSGEIETNSKKRKRGEDERRDDGTQDSPRKHPRK